MPASEAEVEAAARAMQATNVAIPDFTFSAGWWHELARAALAAAERVRAEAPPSTLAAVIIDGPNKGKTLGECLITHGLPANPDG